MEIWFVTGSQHLYGEETLAKVAANSKEVAGALNAAEEIAADVVWKPVVTTPESVLDVCRAANAADECVGLVMWMHTFSPSRMWIAGLSALQKPFVHLHTQYGRDIPWSEIDMDFMNLNQSAHGGREFGYICTRLGKKRAVVVGHWQDPSVVEELGVWSRAALGWHESQNLKVARFGDNMREVAVTEGNKVSAQIKFGYAVNGYAMGDLVEVVDGVSEARIDELLEEYRATYIMPAEDVLGAVREQARIELGMREFLEKGGFGAFTTTFENLHGLRQLPGLAVQRLMASGYGFGAEGDWKTAAMLRIMKVMGAGLEGGTSFMEDYTYHLDPSGMQVLGAHMLEVCPSVAIDKPLLEVHPLGIGGKEAPARLVFSGAAGEALNISLIDMGDRFRMVANEVDAVLPEKDLPNLPVARVLWQARPNLKVAAAAWILAGGAHHTVYSQQADLRHVELFCDMADIELLVIDESTDLRSFRKDAL
jgi:L-arabinose isomerase